MTLTIVALVWCTIGAVWTFSIARNRSNRRAIRGTAAVLCVLNAAAVVVNALILVRLSQ